MTNPRFDILDAQIKEAVGDAHRRRRKNRVLASIIRLSVITCTAAIPVLLGLRVADEGLSQTLSNVALILGALATALNAWEAFYSHKDLWAVNTAAYTQLVALEAEFDYLTAEGKAVTDDILNETQRQLRRIVAEASSAWVGIRQTGARLPSPEPSTPPRQQSH